MEIYHSIVLYSQKQKLMMSFPIHSFLLENCEIRHRHDRTKNAGSLTEYARKGLPHKTMKIFQTKESESIFSEITTKNIKWLVVSILGHQMTQT